MMNSASTTFRNWGGRQATSSKTLGLSEKKRSSTGAGGMSGRCWQEQGCWQSIESMWPGAFPGKGDCHGRLDERNGNESVRSINDYGVHTYRVGLSHGWTYLSIPLFAVVARCLGGQVPMLS